MRRYRHHLFRWVLNLWPPYFGAGIHVRSVAPDFSTVEVEMKLRFWNRNYVGTHFGGSLYAMADPFFMLILIQQLGPGFVVWDKAATVRFKRPGRGRVRARFHVPPAEVEVIRSRALSEPKVEPVFTVEVKDDEGTTIAEVEKLLYVRRKT